MLEAYTTTCIRLLEAYVINSITISRVFLVLAQAKMTCLF